VTLGQDRICVLFQSFGGEGGGGQRRAVKQCLCLHSGGRGAAGNAGQELIGALFPCRHGCGGLGSREVSYIWGIARLADNVCSFAPKHSGEVVRWRMLGWGVC
jgi:hypothetical protein